MQSHSAMPWYSLFYQRGHLLALSIIILIVAGLSALTNLPRLEDPRIDTRNVLVLTPYPGASAERVEALVTDVLEDELRQLFEIKDIKSTSRAGMSVLSVELQDWVDSSNNEQVFAKMRDAIDNAAMDFPQGAAEPELDEKRGATAFTLQLAIKPTAPYVDMGVLSRLADELADRLRNVAGTELVRVYGDVDEEITVTIDPEQLSTAGLTMAQVSQLVSAADPKLPAGVVHTPLQDIRVQVASELGSLDVIRNIPLISDDGHFLRLGDIAEVERGWRQPMSDMALHDGDKTVVVAARMQTTVRVDHWTKAAIQKVDQFNREFAGSVEAVVAFEQNHYTASRLADLSGNLLIGCMVVMLVILVFMGMRASLIVGLALPLVVAFTVFSLSLYGVQIHQMSIFGIIIAIGLLIDNAIVITDEMRINLQDHTLSRLQAMVKSVNHLFSPLLASTLTTIFGFMPIFLLNGNIGDFIGSIAISVVMALIGSLAISLTIIAALAARFLPREPASASTTKWYNRGISAPELTAGFKVLLGKAIKRPLPVLAMCMMLPAAGFILAGQLGNVFFPSADRDQFEIYVWTPTGSAIQQTQQTVMQMDQQIRQHPSVKSLSWLVGGSAPSVYYNQVMTRDNSPNFANAVVTTNTVAEAATLIATLQQQLSDNFPQVKVVARAFGQGPPIAAPVQIDVYGHDLGTLDQLGQQVRLAMSKIPGITQSISSINFAEPELRVNTNHDTGRLANLSLADISQQLQLALVGRTGGSVLESTEEIPIRVRLPQDSRGDLVRVGSLPLLSEKLVQQNQWIPMTAVGELSLTPIVGGITRIDGERVNKVQAYLLPGVPAIDVANELRRMLDEGGIRLPEGYRIQMAGDADEQGKALGQLGTYAPVLMLLMLATLILSFNSTRLAGVIGLVAALSVGLGMFSLWLSGLPIGFNPLLGSAGLIGVAINGSIVVIAAINGNPRAKLGDTREVVNETLSCSRHILSTTVTTVGGLIPLLLFSEGSFWPPLAVVLAGGVGFSVMLSLVFTPVMVAWIGRRKAQALGANLEPALQGS